MNKREEEKLKRQQEKLKKELERTEAMSVFEKEHSDCQYTMRLWNVLLQRESVL